MAQATAPLLDSTVGALCALRRASNHVNTFLATDDFGQKASRLMTVRISSQPAWKIKLSGFANE